jgi:hypothetical protein
MQDAGCKIHDIGSIAIARRFLDLVSCISVSLPHFNRNIRTHLSAKGASVAGPFAAAILHGVVSALVEGGADLQELLGACRSTELAAFAIGYVNDNLAHLSLA